MDDSLAIALNYIIRWKMSFMSLEEIRLYVKLLVPDSIATLFASYFECYIVNLGW